MTRAYIRLDPAFDEHKYAYPDGAYAALVATLCLAEHQAIRGRFRNAEYLGKLLGKRGRWVNFLLEHGDLKALRDGRVYVIGWDEWQEGDWKVGERMRRVRMRQKSTATDTVGVTVPVTVGRLGAGAGGDLAVVDDDGFDKKMTEAGIAPIIRGKAS